jgi:hypothetical protein
MKEFSRDFCRNGKNMLIPPYGIILWEDKMGPHKMGKDHPR